MYIHAAQPGADTDETENKCEVLRNAVDRLDFPDCALLFRNWPGIVGMISALRARHKQMKKRSPDNGAGWTNTFWRGLQPSYQAW